MWLQVKFIPACVHLIAYPANACDEKRFAT
jgi:hypothetical protein